MKNLLVLAITVASMTAIAQSEMSATATTSSESAAATTAAPVKKASAGKKSQKNTTKKDAKATKQTTSMAADIVAPIVSSENPITQKEEKAMTPASTAGAAGTSTAKVSEADAAKKWKGTFRTVTDMDEAKTNSIQTITTVGASYKASNKLTLKVSENFESLNASGVSNAEQRDLVNRSNFRAAYTDFAIASSLPAMIGTAEMPISLVYKKMSGDAVITQKGGYATADAFVELNLGIPYSITPKIDLSIDSQIRHVVKDSGPNSNRFLVIPSLSYTINDIVSVYQAAGLIVSTKENTDFRRTLERMYLATGVSISATKNLNFDINVSQDKAIYASPTSGIDLTEFSAYHANVAANTDRTLDAVAYELVATYNF